MGSSLSTWANVGEAVGTLSAVVVALFLRVYMVRRRRPSLYLDFDIRKDPGCLLEVDEKDQSIYFRPRVVNKQGKETARNVQVFFTGAALRSKEDARVLSSCPSRNFGWSDVPDESLRVAPGGWRRFDALVILIDREQGTGSEGPVYCVPNLKVYSEGWPPPIRHRVYEEGKYAFQLVVTADDCDASSWVLSFEFAPRPAAGIAELREQVSGVKVVEGVVNLLDPTVPPPPSKKGKPAAATQDGRGNA